MPITMAAAGRAMAAGQAVIVRRMRVEAGLAATLATGAIIIPLPVEVVAVAASTTAAHTALVLAAG